MRGLAFKLRARPVEVDAVLYRGKVMHTRFSPRRVRFDYRVFSLLLDVSRLDELGSRLKFFSVNRFIRFLSSRSRSAGWQ